MRLTWIVGLLVLAGCGERVAGGDGVLEVPRVDAAPLPDLAECAAEVRVGGGCYVDPTICVESCGAAFQCLHGRWTPAECTGR